MLAFVKSLVGRPPITPAEHQKLAFLSKAFRRRGTPASPNTYTPEGGIQSPVGKRPSPPLHSDLQGGDYLQFNEPARKYAYNLEAIRHVREAGGLTTEHLGLVHALAVHTQGTHMGVYERVQDQLHRSVRDLATSVMHFQNPLRDREFHLQDTPERAYNYDAADQMHQAIGTLGRPYEKHVAALNFFSHEIHQPKTQEAVLGSSMSAHHARLALSQPGSAGKISRIGMAKASFMLGHAGHPGVATLDRNVSRALARPQYDQKLGRMQTPEEAGESLRNWVKLSPEHYRSVEAHLTHHTTAGHAAQKIVRDVGAHPDFATNIAGFLAWNHQTARQDAQVGGRRRRFNLFHGGTGSLWDHLNQSLRGIKTAHMATGTAAGSDILITKSLSSEHVAPHIIAMMAIGAGIHSALCGPGEHDDDHDCSGALGASVIHFGHHLLPPMEKSLCFRKEPVPHDAKQLVFWNTSAVLHKSATDSGKENDKETLMSPGSLKKSVVFFQRSMLPAFGGGSETGFGGDATSGGAPLGSGAVHFRSTPEGVEHAATHGLDYSRHGTLSGLVGASTGPSTATFHVPLGELARHNSGAGSGLLPAAHLAGVVHSRP